jgi:hypothetical protein
MEATGRTPFRVPRWLGGGLTVFAAFCALVFGLKLAGYTGVLYPILFFPIYPLLLLMKPALATAGIAGWVVAAGTAYAALTMLFLYPSAGRPWIRIAKILVVVCLLPSLVLTIMLVGGGGGFLAGP